MLQRVANLLIVTCLISSSPRATNAFRIILSDRLVDSISFDQRSLLPTSHTHTFCRRRQHQHHHQHRHDTSLHASMQRLKFNSVHPQLKNGKEPPKLILISGSPGTGKSTFGMSLALEQGILKCISTDTVRAVMRSYVPEDISPPLHRSSYAPSSDDGTDDPVKSWIETCKVLNSSVEGLVDDAIRRGVSLVLEGVSIKPSRQLLDKFRASGGVACGVLLMVSDEERHKQLLRKRGFMTGKKQAEDEKLQSFERIRLIQAEMIRYAKENDWILIEQRVDPDPLDVVSNILMKDYLIDELDEDCLLPMTFGSNPKHIDIFSTTSHHVEVSTAVDDGSSLDHNVHAEAVNEYTNEEIEM